jgi:hypothetical protein
MANFNLIKPALSNLSIAYKNAEYIGETLLPSPAGVTKESAKYYVFDKENLRLTADVRAHKSASNRATFQVSTGTYQVMKHALHDLVDDNDRANAAGTGLDPEADVTMNLTDKIKLRIEFDAAALVFGTANYSTGQKAALSGNLRWDVASSADPIAQMLSGRLQVAQAVGVMPTQCVLGPQPLKAAMVNDKILDRTKYTSSQSITAEILARLFMVREVLSGETIRNTAREGDASDSLSFVWGDKAALIYTPARATLRTPSFGYNFRRMQRVVRSWFSNKENADVIEVEDEYDLKLVDGSAGYILDDVTS